MGLGFVLGVLEGQSVKGLSENVRGWYNWKGGNDHALCTRDTGQGPLCFWVLGTIRRVRVKVVCIGAQPQVTWKCRRPN